MVRAMLLAAVAALSPAASGLPQLPVPPPPAAAPVRGWQWPLEPGPAVVRPFRAPPTPWSAGHRGVDLAASAGAVVHAAAAGQVTFAGVVAGRGVVVVTHAGGLRTTYEPVDDRVPAGAFVVGGAALGVVAVGASHCPPASCLHWGARRGAEYVDPLTLVGRGPPVLLPLG